MTSPSVHHVRAALRWLRFARLAGARFDVEAKTADALAFCAEHDAAGFALPSALDGTSRYQPALAVLADALTEAGRPVRLGLSICRVGEGAGSPRLVVSSPDGPLGYLRRKHLRWALPLARHGLAVYALRVTGGTAAKPTRGCNVALAHVAEALASHERAERQRPAIPSARLAA